MVNLRLAVLALAIALPAAPVCAQGLSSLAPADEYFGHYRLSVLGGEWGCYAMTAKDFG